MFSIENGNISITRGDTFCLRITKKDPAGEIVPLTLEDKIKFVVKVDFYTDPLLVKHEYEILSDGTGIFQFDTDETSFCPGSYIYNVEIICNQQVQTSNTGYFIVVGK